ncbi:MAG: hypothetical protein WC091_20445, partial [Sulfuricellaceae bacterium]
EQVNQAITQMDEVTQQNAALVEEAAAAAESLEEQAQNLAQSVSVFKLDNKAGMGMARAPAPKSTSKAVAHHAPARPAAKPAHHAAPAKPAARLTAKPAKIAADDDEWQEF